MSESSSNIEQIIQGYLDQPLKEITEKDYWYALEVLPPMEWRTTDGVEHFLMMEFTCGPVTEQYAQYQGRFFSKPVNAYKRDTWITRTLIEDFIKG